MPSFQNIAEFNFCLIMRNFHHLIESIKFDYSRLILLKEWTQLALLQMVTTKPNLQI